MRNCIFKIDELKLKDIDIPAPPLVTSVLNPKFLPEIATYPLTFLRYAWLLVGLVKFD